MLEVRRVCFEASRTLCSRPIIGSSFYHKVSLAYDEVLKKTPSMRSWWWQ